MVSVEEFFTTWVFGLTAATLRAATPITLAALGGLFSERGGIVNIALEGLMLVGAFFAIWGADLTGSWIGGVIIAMIAGLIFSMLHAVATVTYRADQIISGTALILLAAGFVNFLLLSLYSGGETPADISRVPQVFGFNLLVFVMLALIPTVWYVVFRTPFGLHLRSSGEHPRAADTVGIDVFRVRYIAVGLSGIFAALAGAYLAFDVGQYTQGMSGGLGFIALAALIFGKWNPWGAFAAALLFGFATALGDRLQSVEAVSIPPELVTSLPYVLTIVALAGFVGKSRPPKAVGIPYDPQGH